MTASTTSPTRGRTIREALQEAVRASSDFNPNDVVAPVAILWPDESRAWEHVMPVLGMLRILKLGPYDPDHGTGPVSWLRMQTLLAGGDVESHLQPIVYLPGVSRRLLSEPESLDDEWQPLAGLVVRSAIFANKNGSDWTPSAFFTNIAQGLGLSMANTADTREALIRSLPRLLDLRIADLQGRTLTAADFDIVDFDDVPRQILQWLGDPVGVRTRLESEGKWKGFTTLVKKEYKVDVVREGELAAAKRLGDRDGKWAEVWGRFADAPHAYPGVVEALRLGKPEGMLDLHRDSWPQNNEEDEQLALAALERLAGEPAVDIRTGVRELHAEHGPRLRSVWAQLGRTPAAIVVQRLATLAELTGAKAVGTTTEELASAYATSGWRADEAFVNALASVEPGHASGTTVQKVAEALYRPWLEATVAAFQEVWASARPGRHPPGVDADSPAGTCALFIDGLRFDVGAALASALEGNGFKTELDWGIAGVPTVTGTCKPAVSPIEALLESGPELMPRAAGGGLVNQETLKRVMADNGWSFVPIDSTGDPAGRGWTEGGDIDKLGHDLGAKLAHQIPTEVRILASRISELLSAGWQRVVVVTDHGWLLLPGRLPKHHLSEHLTVVRKGRCARLSDGAASPAGITVLPWRWDEDAPIAVAPGIHAFEGGKVYEHGGLSPQESVVPRLVVSRPGATAASSAVAVDLTWSGLRLKVQATGAPEGSTADLRTKAGDPATSVAREPKPLKSGKASLMVDDDHSGVAAILIVVAPQGNLLASKPTLIPEG